MTEQEILRACQNGDRAAFELLFRENQKRVYSVALNFFSGNRQAAEDVTQQVFLKLFRNLMGFRGDSQLATWLYRITVNICIDEQRKRQRFSFVSDIFETVKRSGREDSALETQEISGEIGKAIGKLKPKFRVPILLKYSEGLSYREMADVLGCSEGTVASRLNRGHKMLAQRLSHLKDEI